MASSAPLGGEMSGTKQSPYEADTFIRGLLRLTHRKKAYAVSLAMTAMTH